MNARPRSAATAGLHAALLALAACTITEEVTPVQDLATHEVCIVENPPVRAGFLVAYQDQLAKNGYQPRLLPPDSGVTSCPVTSTYVALWSWDLAIYMSYAEIKVYEDGRPAGEVVYDSRRGGARVFDKFVTGDTRAFQG